MSLRKATRADVETAIAPLSASASGHVTVRIVSEGPGRKPELSVEFELLGEPGSPERQKARDALIDVLFTLTRKYSNVGFSGG